MVPSYHRPASVAEALKLKDSLGQGAVFLAGGTEVNNLHAARPKALIDLVGLGLDKIEVSPKGVRIGSGVTFQQLVEHPEVPWFLKTAAGQMANRNIRNRATVGGHLGINRSCADLIPTLLAAEAQVALVDRELPIEKFLAGEPGLILSVFVPATTRAFGLGNQTRTANDISIVTASASLALEGKNVKSPILAIGGVAAHVVRLHDVEASLDGKPLPAPEQLEACIAESVKPIDDLRGSAAYKRQIAAVLGERALRAAVTRLVSAVGAR
ncbi:MAG TPA: FAD binding domain-containing protein [Myxococcales bacterium]|jgi:carbon-monoxide dehydrogenase medium subunit